MQERRVLIVGCGFVGEKLADLLQSFHSTVPLEITAWTASEASANELRNLKSYKEIAACDISNIDSLHKEFVSKKYSDSTFDTIVHCASSSTLSRSLGPNVSTPLENSPLSPSKKKELRTEFYRKVYLNGTLNLLKIFNPSRYLFTGSTSVYGQLDGSWVDENSQTIPERETGEVLLETEKVVLNINSNPIVARLAGIYGPHRSVLLKKFIENKAKIEGDGSRWINQVHRDDIASALAQFVIEESIPKGIYNIVDDTPLTQLELYQKLSEIFSKSLPCVSEIDFTGRQRAWTNKRVRNAKMKKVTSWKPQFSSFFDAIETLKDQL